MRAAHSFVVNRIRGVVEAIHSPHSPFGVTWPLSSVRALPAPSSSDDDEKALLPRVARGDVAALRVLYDAYAGRAMAIAMRVLRNETAAEDVIQETFLEVWRRAAEFDSRRGGIAAWITTIARSRAIDRLRLTATRSQAIEAASGLLIPMPQPLPSEDVERRRDEARVAAALAELPFEQRRAIELAYFEGLTQGEIATKTHSPLGTVKERVKLAINKLAKLLKSTEE